MTAFLYFAIALVFLIAGIFIAVFIEDVHDRGSECDFGFLLAGILCLAFGILLCFVQYDFARTEKPIEFTTKDKVDTLIRFNDGVQDTAYVLTFKK